MGKSEKSIATLLDQMESGELVLPEIQREFVWKRKNVQFLFDSLYRGLPIGYLLIWKARTIVTERQFKGRRKRGEKVNNLYGYLLDGQQRLTAIRLVRDRDENYPLLFNLREEDEERPDENRFCFETARLRRNPWYISVADIITGQVNYKQVLDRLRDEAGFDVINDENKVIIAVSKLRSIMDYKVGIEEFEDDDYRKATELFIRFNSTGVKLKKADLVAAELALHVPDLVSKGINRFCTSHSHFNFNFSSTFLTQCLTVIHTDKIKLEKPKDLVDGSTKKEISSSWKRTEKGINRAIEFLTGTVMWDSLHWLPSFNSLIPLIFLLSKKGLSTTERRLARKWLLTVNMNKAFHSATHSEIDRILKYLKGDPTVTKLLTLSKKNLGKIQPVHFDTRRKSGAAMSLYISMLRNCNAKDWESRTSLDGKVIGHNAELQVHHFFPRNLLQVNGVGSDRINTFANYTIINKDTNIKISNEEPLSYVKRLNIRKKDLTDQCIPMEKSLWSVDRYEDFLAERKKLLASNANSFLKKL